MYFILRLLGPALAALLLVSCSSTSGVSTPAAIAGSPRSSSPAGGLDAASNRPGLATSFGETRASRAERTMFQRERVDRPLLVQTLRYDDVAGLEAAGALQNPRFGALRPRELVAIALLDARGRALPLFSKGFFAPEAFVAARKGERYSILLRNDSTAKLEFVVSVDGLDVLDGKPAAYTKGGYLLAPGQSMRVEGWRTSLQSVAAFRFGAVADSYAEKKYGDSRNVGVIGVAVFEERGSDPQPRRKAEERLRRRADPFPNSGGFAEPPGRH
ncbi:MAG: hypothetical protein JSR82_07295 [Verrucomicrobia bacterium]|nr:hypothetical protein [Verrucomicrobiota bacterium]